MAYRERSSAGLYAYGGLPYWPYWSFFPYRSTWLYSPRLNGFTLIPHDSYRSYWGYRFAPAFVFGGVSSLDQGMRPADWVAALTRPHQVGVGLAAQLEDQVGLAA